MNVILSHAWNAAVLMQQTMLDPSYIVYIMIIFYNILSLYYIDYIIWYVDYIINFDHKLWTIILYSLCTFTEVNLSVLN